MPFAKGDPNINRKGRGTGAEILQRTLTKSEQRDKELKQILRRLKPLNSKVISEFEKMFMNEATTEAGKIKLGVFLLKTYTDLIDDVYKETTVTKQQQEDEDDEQPTGGALISFKVLDKQA